MCKQSKLALHDCKSTYVRILRSSVKTTLLTLTLNVIQVIDILFRIHHTAIHERRIYKSFHRTTAKLLKYGNYSKHLGLKTGSFYSNSDIKFFNMSSTYSHIILT